MKKTLTLICLVVALNSLSFAQEQDEISKNDEKKYTIGVSVPVMTWSGDLKFDVGVGGSAYAEFAINNSQFSFPIRLTYVELNTPPMTMFYIEGNNKRYQSSKWTYFALEMIGKYLLSHREASKLNPYLGGELAAQTLFGNSKNSISGVSFGATFGAEYLFSSSFILDFSAFGKYALFTSGTIDGESGKFKNSFGSTVLGCNLTIGYHF
jgi:hypothetical protein